MLPPAQLKKTRESFENGLLNALAWLNKIKDAQKAPVNPKQYLTKALKPSKPNHRPTQDNNEGKT